MELIKQLLSLKEDGETAVLIKMSYSWTSYEDHWSDEDEDEDDSFGDQESGHGSLLVKCASAEQAQELIKKLNDPKSDWQNSVCAAIAVEVNELNSDEQQQMDVEDHEVSLVSADTAADVEMTYTEFMSVAEIE